MIDFDYILKNENGMHARPAGALVKKVSSYNSRVTIFKGDRSVNVKSLFDLLSFGIKQNDKIRISIEGDDESEAEIGIRSLLDENFK